MIKVNQPQRSGGSQLAAKDRLVSRRLVLRGAGGVALGLPFLEGLAPRTARAQTPVVPPFAIFFRQANGVAAEQENEEIGNEPERFWPRQPGALDAANLEGRALDELTDYASRLLVVGNVNMENYDYGDGHARGALQGLTARGPVVPGAGGDSEASGESLDHRIGRELNPSGQDSLFLYAGQPNGWLGGPCISYRGSNNRRSALNDPRAAYQLMVGETDGLPPEAVQQIMERNQSVNDLVREQLRALLARPELSARDRQRLDLHLTSIRELESSLSCRFEESKRMELDGLGSIYESNDGNEVLTTARAHMDVAALAVACGFTRSVAIQVGNGNDGNTRFWNPETGTQMENYHYVSHRRVSHDASGDVIAGSDLLHHLVDRQFAQAFRYLLDRLSAYDIEGQTLLDYGTAVWYNDLGNGPGHAPWNVPHVIAGSAGGYFRQGQFIQLDDNEWGVTNHARVLNAIATAVGCRTEGSEVCEDHGDPEQDRTPHPELGA